MGDKQKRILIMKGGGIKGLAYIGALEILEEYYDFYWYAGTSAGAITALLLAAGYSTDELKTILADKDFNDFKDASVLKAIWNLPFKQGLYEAKTFGIWMDKLLAKKLNSPVAVLLEELPKRVSVYASKRGHGGIRFDSTVPKTKEEEVSFAARCSMSIPFIFTPQKDGGKGIFDGGMQNNYPVEILLRENPNAEFIGFYLGPETFEGYPKKISLVRELITIWMENVNVQALRKYKEQTVIIDTRPISTLQFKLNKDEKEFLLETGRVSAIKFSKRKGIIDDKHEHLNNFNQRIENLEKKRDKLKLAFRRKKYWDRIKVLAILLLLASGVFLLIKRGCLEASFQGASFSKGIQSFWDCATKTEKVKDAFIAYPEHFENEQLVKVLSIQDARAYEGNLLTFPILLDKAYDSTIKFNFEIKSESATSGEDFSLIGGNTVIIDKGSQNDTIVIKALADQLNEDIESFSVRLRAELGQKIQFIDSIGLGTIINKEPPLPPKKAFIKGKIIDEQGYGINQVDVSHEENGTKTNQTGFFFLHIPEKKCDNGLIRIEIKKGNKMLTKAVRICREDLIIGLTN